MIFSINHCDKDSMLRNRADHTMTCHSLEFPMFSRTFCGGNMSWASCYCAVSRFLQPACVLPKLFVRTDISSTVCTDETIFSNAEKFAATRNKRSTAWSPEYSVLRRLSSGPRYQRFAESFSAVLSEEATGTMWVVAPASPEDPGRWVEPWMTSVWAKVEYRRW